MPRDILKGTTFRAADKLEALREKIHGNRFQIADDIRQFVNRYVEANPDQARGKSTRVLDELVGNIRSELGLAPSAQAGVTMVISDQVRNLILGRAQASEDTARWAVHHAANEVTMYSGQFVYDAEDIFIDGAGMDFLFHRTYKSQGFYNGPLGINWDHNYNLGLREVDGKIVRLTGGFQETEYTWHIQNSYWVPPPGEHSVILDSGSVPAGVLDVPIPQSAQGFRYLLRLPNGTVYLYNQDPSFPTHFLISCIMDRFGNALEFTHEQGQTGISRIKTVAINPPPPAAPLQPPPRWVTFEYDSQDHITFIRDHSGRIWRYTYDDFGDLIAFTTPGTDDYPEGLTERYVYSTPYYTGELQHNLVQVYDTAGRAYLENEYGTDSGLLSFNRVVCQREGSGGRFFEYEDVSLATGLPVGQPEIEEDMPAHQTVMTRRNGHPVHYIYNKFGNLIAREEDAWASGTRRRLVTHYRYNRDGALIGQISPEGRVTQYIYRRDDFIRSSQIANPTEEELRRHSSLTWQTRLGFGNRLAIIQRGKKLKGIVSFDFPNPLSRLGGIVDKDIVVKFSYYTKYQNIATVSDPRYTKHPFSDAQEDKHFHRTLTRFTYKDSERLLEQIQYPDTTRNKQPDVSGIQEQFLGYDSKGRLTEYEDQVGTRMRLVYFPASADPDEAPKEGYLQRQVIDPADPLANPDGLNLETAYDVNAVGVVTKVMTPKKQVITFDVDDLNRVTKVTRALPPRVDPVTGMPKPQVDYQTCYTYCRNMRVERIERDVHDENGQELWGGTEVQFFHYDENDNVSRQQIGSPDFDDHLITRHTYDDGDLRVGTTLPRGNRIRIDYDERRLPRKITRGAGSEEAVEVKVVYDGDGLLVEQRDGRNLKTSFAYDAFGRGIETRDYDQQDRLYRLIRQDYDKAGNLTIERLFVPEPPNTFKLLYHASYRYNELNQRIEARVRRIQTFIPYNLADVENKKDEVPSGEAVRTLYFYDRGGRLTRLEQHGKRLDTNGNPEPNDTILASTYGYNAVGWLTAETDPLGNRTETRYDRHGLVTRVDVREKVAASPTGEEVFTTLYGYDELDRLQSITDGLGNVTRFEYDSRDAVIRQIDPLGNVTRFDYDIYGRQAAERIEMTDTGLGGGPRPPNSDIVTQFVYDANGNLMRLIDAHNTPTDQAYDALDRRVELRYVDGTATTYRYDGNDNVVRVQDNNGLVKRTTYDLLDNPLRMDVDTRELKPGLVVEGATYEAFEYDALGQTTRAKNDWADIYFKVDSLGRVYEESVQFSDLPETFTLKRRYDDFGFLVRLTYPNGRILAYQPDALNRIKRIDNVAYGTNYPGHTNLPPQRMILENSYRGLRIGRKAYGNGARTDYAYDGAGRVIEIAHISAQNMNLLTLQHLYDAAGNMRFKYEYLPPGQPHYGEIYKYDSRYQLTYYQEIVPPSKLNLVPFAPEQVLPPDNPQFNGQVLINNYLGQLAQVPNVFTFKYDKLGNRLEERSPDQQQTIAYVANNLNQYTQRDGSHYTYDPTGNLQREQTGITTRNYIHNHRNQVVRVTEGGDLARFRYDALGRLIWSDITGEKTHFLFDDENIIEELKWLSTQQNFQSLKQYASEFDIDGRCHLAVKGDSNRNEYWYHKDLVGSTRTFTNINGTNVNGNNIIFYRFTPFGKLTNGMPAHENSYLFSGRSYISAIEAYDLRARFYFPSLGRFLERDPASGEDLRQLYTYINNNPLVDIDPLGLDNYTWSFGIARGSSAYRRMGDIIQRSKISGEDFYDRPPLSSVDYRNLNTRATSQMDEPIGKKFTQRVLTRTVSAAGKRVRKYMTIRSPYTKSRAIRDAAVILGKSSGTLAGRFTAEGAELYNFYNEAKNLIRLGRGFSKVTPAGVLLETGLLSYSAMSWFDRYLPISKLIEWATEKLDPLPESVSRKARQKIDDTLLDIRLKIIFALTIPAAYHPVSWEEQNRRMYDWTSAIARGRSAYRRMEDIIQRSKMQPAKPLFYVTEEPKHLSADVEPLPIQIWLPKRAPLVNIPKETKEESVVYQPRKL